MKRASWAIALAAFLTFALTGGGRITGSDELAQLNLARVMPGRFDVPPEGSTILGADGKVYTKNTWGQAWLALPLARAGLVAAHLGGFTGTRAELASRFVTSFFNGIVTAVLLGFAYRVMRSLRLSPGASFAATFTLGFTTPLWVSAKGFACEPIEALGMLLAIGGGALAGGDSSPKDRQRGEWWAAVGAFLAIFVKLGVTPMVIACLLSIGVRRPRAWLIPGGGVVAALATNALYNFIRLRNVFDSGYGSQQSFEAFSTPLHVGVLGLLVSSGKGMAWFAPVMWMAPLGLMNMLGVTRMASGPQEGIEVRRAGWSILAAWIVGVLVYGRFQHWGGDGSWGPRYLAPLLPAGAIAVGFALHGAAGLRKQIAWALATVGLLVTLGGVGIYFGAEMREVGDYPYTRALEDPKFMHESHWEPRQSPILVSWRMLSRNLGEHFRGKAPSIAPSSSEANPRTGISHDDERALLHAIDVWWLYACYAGLPGLPLAIVAILLSGASVWAWGRALGAVREDPA